jgi:MinD superfamily P-loop ATPase
MTIAVAGGKGGVGKTMVATSFALLLSRERHTVVLDLDVEEPNAHLFFDVRCAAGEEVRVMLPRVEEEYCDRCGVCQDVCAFHALLVLPDRVLLFPELCKSCRGCVVLCPVGAVVDDTKRIGVVEERFLPRLTVLTGRLDVGRTDVPALIRAVKSRARARAVDGGYDSASFTVIDAPPGCACAAVEAVRAADITVLVTEPTPFGVHDLNLMAQTLRAMGQRFVVLLNKAVPHDDSVQRWCAAEGVDMIGSIPLDDDIARACARGWLLPQALPGNTPALLDALHRLGALSEVRV